MFAVPGAYDRAITVFSPDGRLFQVEYASETVKRGATVLGIASPEGVVLAAEERAGSKLQDLSFMWKIFQIDEHVGQASRPQWRATLALRQGRSLSWST